MFECNFCQHISEDRRKATTHQGSHFGESEYRIYTYPCNFCNRSFATQKALSSHMRQCKSNDQRRPLKPLGLQNEASNETPEPPSVTNEYEPPIITPSVNEPPLEEPNENVPPTIMPSEPNEYEPPTIMPSINVPPLENEYERTTDTYKMPENVSLIDNIDVWLDNLLPPKERQPRKEAAFKAPSSAAELQKLYSRNMKRALDVIQEKLEVNCDIPEHTLFEELSKQFAPTPPISLGHLWQPCPEGIDTLTLPFTVNEIQIAMQHESSAPGPDGWTYRDLTQQQGFAENFLQGVHSMAATGTTPVSWKQYNSLLLCKKPDEYDPTIPQTLKMFRPIALSNVTYKVLMSVITKRLSSWLQRNKGISFNQRAVFSRRGVKENTRIVSEALRLKKTVVYLDLTDAFNSVNHSAILTALEQCLCPQWIIQIIQSVYEGCQTTPVNLRGKKLSKPVSIHKGVRQGCPLSALLFNLFLDPLLKTGQTETSISLGYMDDIALIFEDNSTVAATIQSMNDLATKMGLTFNADKCGVSNYNGDLYIDCKSVPKVSEERAYKYLGTQSFPNMVGGLEGCFKQTWDLAEKIEKSKLTPMQKLHAMRTKVVPMLYHLLENSDTTLTQLERFNRALQKMAKQILYLPEYAANAYIHLHRMYGGAGLPDLTLLKAKFVLQSLLAALNLEDELGSYTQKFILRKLSLDEFIDAINNSRRSGLSKLGKEVISALLKLKQYLKMDIKIKKFDNKIGLRIDNMPYKNPWPAFNRFLQRESLSKLINAPNQGRYWKTLSSYPQATKSVYNFHTKLCDWRYIHKARLNLTPLRGTMLWNRNSDQNCRRCQVARETLNHVINNCPVHKHEIIQRHNAARDKLEEALTKKLKVLKEQRFGNLQPDLILQDSKQHRSYIVDVKVSAECPEIFEFNQRENSVKYDSLRRAFEVQGSSATVHVIQLGALGSIDRDSANFLHKILKSKRKANHLIRMLSFSNCHYSRNVTVYHVSGVQQNF